MDYYKLQSTTQQEITLQSIYESIERGEIKEHNLVSSVPIALYSNHKRKLANALEYYVEKIMAEKDREINVIFMSGGTSLGKTTFAKEICENSGWSKCVSSSSNDPLQDYKGEDVLILDDMRDDSFRFHDFLKLLDNHTKSTSKSRYRNKAFIGHTILITSTKPLNDWYFNVPSEDKRQLYRRVRHQYQFTEERIYAYEYDDKTQKYEAAGSGPNPYPMKFKDKVKLAIKMFDAAGIEFTPTCRAVLEEAADKEDSAKPKNYKETCKKKIDDYLPEK